jgi:chromosome segregation ATPase
MKTPNPLVLLLLVAAGCAAPTNIERAESAASLMREMKTALTDAPAKITAVTTALDALAKDGGDMKAEFQTYSKEVDTLLGHRDKLRGLRKEIDKSREEFTAAWETKTKELASEDMRKLAEQRRAEFATKFGELTKVADAGRNEFEPWLQSVLDVRTYLLSDLNPTGVKAVSDQIKKINGGAASVNKKIETVVTGLEQISTAIAAAKPPAPPAEASATKK